MSLESSASVAWRARESEGRYVPLRSQVSTSYFRGRDRTILALVDTTRQPVSPAQERKDIA